MDSHAPRSKNYAAFGIGWRVTRHPQMGAVDEPQVDVREHVWNECCRAIRPENAGVYRLLKVNVRGMRQLRRVELLAVYGTSTRRLLYVNVSKTQRPGRSWPEYPSLRRPSRLCATLRPLARRFAALTAASAAGEGRS